MANYKVVDTDKLDADLTAVADAIREKTGGTEKLTLDEMPGQIGGIKSYSEGYEAGRTEGIEQGYEQGKIDGNVLLYAITIPNYKNAAFPAGYELTLNIPNLNPDITNDGCDIGNWSNVTGLKRLKLVSSVSVPGLKAITLMYASSIEVFDISEFPRNFKTMLSTFLHCNYLREIIGELDLTLATFNGYEFFNCFALEELRIKAGTLNKSMAIAQSNKLSAESIQSVVDGLADLTGQTAQTLTFHADVGAKLSEEQKATITVKNWTLVY